MPVTNRRWVLASRPDGKPSLDNFRLEDQELRDPGEHEVLVKGLYISVDPGMRSRLSGDSYAQALGIGETIEGAMIGTVKASNNERFKTGDLVMGGFGWQEYALSNGRGLAKLDASIFQPPLTVTAAIGVLGIPGLTAYFGLLDMAKPKEGETVLISSAAGPVGATAGQIARMKGCTVVGIAGSRDKCDYVTKELGFDRCFNYEEEKDLVAAIKQACPKGVDIYFDNVGGEMLDAAITNTNERARLIISGAVAEYNRPEPRGIRNTTRLITHRLRMEGLVVFDYFKQFPQAQAEMAGWIKSGKLKYTEDISEGIETTPEAFLGLFEGENHGRRLIKLG
ncbi:NADP-dependent oxidoreductase [Tepidicaulis sp. LMO-SS28]|uniref:NADP-dependent oxidoreductase n=1 Tax=Tepidicaulis sp. LMO-SS28 TaxID=3447455 RepID=UPI003EE2F906